MGCCELYVAEPMAQVIGGLQSLLVDSYLFFKMAGCGTFRQKNFKGDFNMKHRSTTNTCFFTVAPPMGFVIGNIVDRIKKYGQGQPELPLYFCCQ